MPLCNGFFLPLLFFFLAWPFSDCSATNSCTRHLHYLADRQSKFVQCSTDNSVPVTLCMQCEERYNEMVVAYMILREDKNCTDTYFDKDRINIVSTTQSILVGLWSKAYCDDCFTSNNSYVFDLKRTALLDCLQDHKKVECVACLNDYMDLNSFYKEVEENSTGHVCYDMQDAMNRTRSLWSKELHCCHRDFNITLFAIASSLITLIPVLFYSGLFALGKWRERNHDVLIEDPPRSHISPTPTVITAALPPSSSTATLPHSETPSPNISKKLSSLHHFDDDNTDDSDLEEHLNQKHLAALKTM